MRIGWHILLGMTLVSACESPHPATAVVDNVYPADGGTYVYKAWWKVVEFPDPVAAGESSEQERAIPGADYAYALLARGWDPQSGTPPTSLIVVRTFQPLTARRGHTLHIELGTASVAGDCETGVFITQEEADFITQRIFPDEFADLSYDVSRCLSTPDVSARDAGVP